MKKLILLVLLSMLLSSCGKVVFISVDQNGAQENRINIDDNILKTDDEITNDLKADSTVDTGL